MYLLYVDESGDLGSADSGHVVIGGIAVHESDVRALNRATEGVIAKHLDPQHLHFEIHAQHMRSGKGEWRRIPREVRHDILNDIGDLLGSFGKVATHNFGLFAVVRSPGAVPQAEPLERVYEELIHRFDPFLRKSRQDGIREHGMVIADEAKYEKIVQPLVSKWRSERGNRIGGVRRIVEVPLFLDSKASRQIQLADFVAHAVYLAYESSEPGLFERVVGAFHREQESLHGLTHLSVNFQQCACVACASRRETSHPRLPIKFPPKSPARRRR